MVGIRTAIIAAVLGVSVPAHGEPQEDDACLDKQRGIAFEMQAPFGDRTKNYEQAVGFYKTAAAKGNARAQQLLANAYRNGRGVPRSDLLAVTWYMASAFVCFAEDLPAESSGMGSDMSAEEWRVASEMAKMVALIQRFSRGMRPDCGEYFDKDTWVGHVYPDRDDKRSDELVGTYRTLRRAG